MPRNCGFVARQNIVAVANGATPCPGMYSGYMINQHSATLYRPECIEWLIMNSGMKNRGMMIRPWNVSRQKSQKLLRIRERREVAVFKEEAGKIPESNRTAGNIKKK